MKEGPSVEDIEANTFAALILMPPDMWDEHSAEVDWLDVRQVRQLARTFDVDLPLAYFRQFIVNPKIADHARKRRARQ